MNKKLCTIVLFVLFLASFGASAQTQLGSVQVSSLNNFVFVQDPGGLQAAIQSVCNKGGGTVVLPTLFAADGKTVVPYEQDTTLRLCSNLNILGAGRATANVAGCPTLIHSNLSGPADLIEIRAMEHIHISDLCISYTGSGALDAIHLNWGQNVVIERIFITGPFQAGLELNPVGTEEAASLGVSDGSTVLNSFRDIKMSGLAPGGIGCLLYTRPPTTSRAMYNNTFENVNCIGGFGGIGLQATTGRKGFLLINEILFNGGEFSARNGTGVFISNSSVRDLVMIGADIEDNLLGIRLSSQNEGFTCLGCNIDWNYIPANASVDCTDQTNGQDITKCTPNNTLIIDGSLRTFITGNVGGPSGPQNFSVDQLGNVAGNSLVVSGATPRVQAGQIGLGASLAPTNGTLVSQTPPSGFLLVNIGGVDYKVPYY